MSRIAPFRIESAPNGQGCYGIASREATMPTLRAFAKAHADDVRRTLARCGMAVVRGFPPISPEDLTDLASELTGGTTKYTERSTPRRQVAAATYTSTEYPRDQEIFLHNENAYASQWPAYLYFYCKVPASTGGATVFADVASVERRIDPKVTQECDARGLLHRRNFRRNLGVSWQEAFGVEDTDALRRMADREGYRVVTASSDLVALEYPHGARARHHVDGAPLWFNHAAFFQYASLDPETANALEQLYGPDGLPNRMLFGDGEQIFGSIVEDLRRAYSDCAWEHQWAAGDLVIVDNMRYAHGRAAFSGDRSVWVVMSGTCRRRDLLP